MADLILHATAENMRMRGLVPTLAVPTAYLNRHTVFDTHCGDSFSTSPVDGNTVMQGSDAAPFHSIEVTLYRRKIALDKIKPAGNCTV